MTFAIGTFVITALGIVAAVAFLAWAITWHALAVLDWLKK